ncbi:MAG: OsmC family protein [Polyangiaceae bacterium]
MSKAIEPDVVVRGAAADFVTTVDAGRHRLIADEPTRVGGSDSGPSPYELLLASLGSCTSMTLGLYARRKGWPLEEVDVRLRHSKVHADDCAECDSKPVLLDRIEREILLVGALTDEQRARLLEIADKCPVHRTLTGSVDVRTRLLP